jgi:hypothetical protein
MESVNLDFRRRAVRRKKSEMPITQERFFPTQLLPSWILHFKFSSRPSHNTFIQDI